MAEKRKRYKKVVAESSQIQTEWVFPILTEKVLFTISVYRTHQQAVPVFINNSLSTEQCETTVGFFPLDCKDYVNKVLQTEIPREALDVICDIGMAILADKIGQTSYILEFKGA